MDPGKWRRQKEREREKKATYTPRFHGPIIAQIFFPQRAWVQETPLGVGSTWKHVRGPGGVVDWSFLFHFKSCHPLFLASSPRVLGEVSKAIKVVMLYSPASPEVLTEQYGVRVVAQLHEDLQRSASRWAVQHLVAFRLLVEPQHLPVLNHTDEKCAFRNEPNTQQNTQKDIRQTTLINSQAAGALLSVTPPGLLHMDATEIMRMEAGLFWAALARALRLDMSDKIHPQRASKPAKLAHGHITWDEAKKRGELPSSVGI